MAQLTVSEIKQALIDNGISQQQMADHIFTTKDYINQVLNGRTKPSTRVLIKMNTFIKMKVKK